MDSEHPGYMLVDQPGVLERLVDRLRPQTRVGLDTEADSLHHYFDKVCLIQTSFAGENYIIDPLAGLSLESFLEVLAEKELILQGADYDLRMLKKTFGFRPKAPVFDTMIAAQLLGYPSIGLGALVERFCGVLLSKSSQKADWSLRPLSGKLLRYASDDTRYLETVADAMRDHLRSLGRLDWHAQSCERVKETAWLSEKKDSQEAWRVKGSSKQTPRELAYLRELWKWRDEEARQKDRPPFMILRNEDLIELAVRQAAGGQDLFDAGPVFLKRIQGERRERLERAIRAAKNLPEAEWPAAAERKIWRPEDPGIQKKVEALAGLCKKTAQHLAIDPSILASRAALSAVVRGQAHTLEAVMTAGGLVRWQAEFILAALKTMKE